MSASWSLISWSWCNTMIPKPLIPLHKLLKNLNSSLFCSKHVYCSGFPKAPRLWLMLPSVHDILYYVSFKFKLKMSYSLLCIMAFCLSEVYLMLGSKKLMCFHVHCTDTRLVCGLKLWLYVIVVTMCCQFCWDSSKETAVSGEQLHREVCHTACESVGALHCQSKGVAV